MISTVYVTAISDFRRRLNKPFANRKKSVEKNITPGSTGWFLVSREGQKHIQSSIKSLWSAETETSLHYLRLIEYYDNFQLLFHIKGSVPVKSYIS